MLSWLMETTVVLLLLRGFVALLVLVQMVISVVLMVVVVGGGCVAFGGHTVGGLVIVGDDGSVRSCSWLKHREQEWQGLRLASCLQFDCFLFIKI